MPSRKPARSHWNVLTRLPPNVCLSISLAPMAATSPKRPAATPPHSPSKRCAKRLPPTPAEKSQFGTANRTEPPPHPIAETASVPVVGGGSFRRVHLPPQAPLPLAEDVDFRSRSDSIIGYANRFTWTRADPK